jgi:hypothetical protein
MTDWTDWFCGIMASPVDDSTVLILLMLGWHLTCHPRHLVSPSTMVSLNEPITVHEVVEILQALPCGKSADLQGLTCELLRVAVVRVPNASQDAPDVEYVCEPLATCLTDILHNASARCTLPAVLQVSTLTPVPKSGQASGAAGLDHVSQQHQRCQHFQ